MRPILLCCTILVTLISYSAAWSLPLEYSVKGGEFIPLGSVNINANGNLTFGEFHEENSALKVLSNMLEKVTADAKLPTYKIRSGKSLFCSNNPRSIDNANYAHTFHLTVDQNSRSLLSVCHYPRVNNEPTKVGSTKSNVVLMVETVVELPSPDTATYLLRLEEEKRSRQHGATQDNRSFLAKYWYYILPVVIFMVLSNAFNTDQGNASE